MKKVLLFLFLAVTLSSCEPIISGIETITDFTVTTIEFVIEENQ